VEDWTATKNERGVWQFTWSGAPADIFNVWLDGVLIATVTGTEYDFDKEGYDATPPPLEIVDDEDDAESELYPPFAIIQWRTVDGAAAYLVERLVSASWVVQKTITEDGSGWYAFTTVVLGDQTSEQYRVSALDSRTNAGTAVAYTFALVRNPAPPSVSYAIDGAKDLEVSAA